MTARQQEQRSRMIEENIGLVHACAHRFKGKGIEYDDLFQAGCMGLVKATDAFDSERGVRFSTYAVPVILGEMRRLFRDGGTVKVSRSLKELSMKAARQRDQFAKERGREPTVSELAQALQVSEEAVVEALGAGAPPVSLTSEEDSSQLDLPVSSPEEQLSDLLSLRQMLTQLEERDRRLIELRYFRNMTQVKTAQELGMTQVQAPPPEKKILLLAARDSRSDSSESLTRSRLLNDIPFAAGGFLHPPACGSQHMANRTTFEPQQGSQMAARCGFCWCGRMKGLATKNFELVIYH